VKAVYIGYLAASVCIALPFIYWATALDWHKTRTGRAMMMMLSSLAALFTILLTSFLVPDPTFREALRYLVYSYVLVAGVRLAFLFFQLRMEWAKGQAKP
jgi:hypothetical protein